MLVNVAGEGDSKKQAEVRIDTDPELVKVLSLLLPSNFSDCGEGDEKRHGPRGLGYCHQNGAI